MNTPKIRFKGFKDDWEQCKLGDVCSRVQGNDGRMELPTLTISAGNGWMRQEDRFSGNIAGKEQKNYTLLRKGELSYNHGNSKLAKYGTVFSLQTYEEALVPRVYHSFKVKEGNCDFVEYYFATKLPDRELSKLISSGARMDGLLNIGYDEFMGIQMKFPSTLEQRKISLYFRKLDHLITLHQRKCDETKELKKFMLQKLFPKNGQKNPEIRFEGFTDDWEQRKVSELFRVTRGYVLAATQTNTTKTDEKPYPVYSSQTKDKGLMGYYKDYLYEDAITWTTDGANAGTVNYRAGKFYCTNVCGVLLSNEVKANQMIAEALNNVAKGYVSYVGNPKLMNNVMADIVIQIPTQAEEREMLSSLFASLDHLITLHQRKCEKLKELKKFMLQNMFV